MQSVGVPLPGLVSEQQLYNYTSKMGEKLPTGKNPFTQRGEWPKEILDQIEISVINLRETTSDFTRKRNPGKRYWRGDVNFKFEQFESRILKMANCPVPYHKNPTYGKDFIYANLQKSVGEAIVAACTKEGITATHFDKKISGTDKDWWATINNTDGSIGTVDSNGDFEPKDVQMIFDVTELGARINLDLVFSVRLTLDDGADRKPTDTFRVVTDCSRGGIKAIKQEVPPPQIETQIPQQRAARIDVADQGLLDAIAALTTK